jgi:glyoxylase-like metal-dependent hydrolase (beta-lactamase superfamily II)
MHRERVSENVYWFQSDVYAQVTAGVIAGPQWSVVIDTLALPDETLGIREFVEHELGVPVRYVINTHYHADHTWGNCFFPNATIIAHERCRELLIERGIPSLEAATKQNPALRQVKIVLPHMTFSRGEMTLKIGKKNLVISAALGHSEDGISILVEEDRVLFAGDAFMPIPYIVDGNVDDITASIKRIGRMGLENIVQGHGDIILRGEIESAVKNNLSYISAIKKAVRTAARRKEPLDYLEEVDIEDCGKSRVDLGGLAVQLHERNLRALLQHVQNENAAGKKR